MSANKSNEPRALLNDQIQQIKYPIFNNDFVLVEKKKFKRELKVKKSANSDQKVIDTSIYCLNLNKILSKNEKDVKMQQFRKEIRKKLKLIRIHDLLHTMVALYDRSLPDIGAEYIYECICARKAYTIFVYMDADDQFDKEYEDECSDSQSTYDETIDCLKSIEIKPPQSIFHDLYSDENALSKSASSSDNEQMSDDGDFTLGVKSFIESYKVKPSIPCHPVKRLIACITFERINTSNQVINCKNTNNEWILLIQLMCVSKEYRGFGIGTYLINFIKSNLNMGIYDAIITSSDEEAIEFYLKHGFNENPILNFKYKSIGDVWTNTTKMCYIPPYLTDNSILLNTEENKYYAFNHDEKETFKEIDELNKINIDFVKWNKIMFNAYQTNIHIFTRLKEEITYLRTKLNTKDRLITDLSDRNKYLEKQLITLKSQALNIKNGANVNNGSTLTKPYQNKDDDDDDADLDKLISELKLLTKSNYDNR